MKQKSRLFWERGGQIENSGTTHPLPGEIPFQRPGGSRTISNFAQIGFPVVTPLKIKN
jgi:hypothetical protein